MINESSTNEPQTRKNDKQGEDGDDSSVSSHSPSVFDACQLSFEKALLALEFSFGELNFLENEVESLIRGSLDEMFNLIQRVLTGDQSSMDNKDRIREKLNLEDAPFHYARRCGYRIHELPRDDLRRQSLQALFLFILRTFVPLKYDTVAVFLESFPEFIERSSVEIESLHVTANLMDLVFYTLQPKV